MRPNRADSRRLIWRSISLVYFYDQPSRRLVGSRNDGMLPISTGLKGSGTREDITGAAIFLASGASDFVTGKYIHVKGGRYAEDMAWSSKT